MDELLDSMLERLLVGAFAPFLSAAPKPKKKPAAKRTAKPVRAKKAKRATAKRAAPKPVKKQGAPAKPAVQARGKVPIASAPAKVAEKVGTPARPVAPTGRAILITPENEKFADSIHPTFRWLSVGSATRYEVAWSETPDFAPSYSVISIATEATVPVEKPLRIGATYYWHVRGGNDGGWGPWSSNASFRALEEPPA